MAHVSKEPLPQHTRREIERQLLGLVRMSGGVTVFEELLTEVELLMLAKRLAIIFMLIDEQSYYRIEQILGVSVSTSKRIHSLLVRGAFSKIENVASHKKQREEILHTIEVLLRGGLPPRTYIIKKRAR